MFISRGQPSIASGTLHKRLIVELLLFLTLFSFNACSLQVPAERQPVGDLGRFEYRGPEPHRGGVVIGAPHGRTDPEAAILARHISERTGAGFVVAHGFKSKRLSVAQPVTRIHPRGPVPLDPAKRGSVFRELTQVLRRISNGEVDLYVELRSRPASEGLDGIQVVSSGFTFEEAKIIKHSYFAAFDRIGKAKNIERLTLSVEPIDKISWDAWGIRNHGVLMVTEKGLSVRIPEQALSQRNLTVYGEIFTAWIEEITRLVYENPRAVPQIEVKLMDLGRFDSIPSRAGAAGVVIGAPHGSYDSYTAGIVKQLAFRTGLAAVIARGFTPTETGDGRRINVNRPTERDVSWSEREFETARARTTYEQFKSTVLSAAGGNLDLYIDIHHNEGSRIEVATVGLSKEEARVVKNAYRAVRDQALAGHPDISVVELAIEPLDVIEVGAWAAKTNGILTVANRSLHFELPANAVISSARRREIYTLVLARLIGKLPAALRGASK